MARNIDRERELTESKRSAGVGDGWQRLDSKLASQIQGSPLFIKSFSIRRNYDGDNPYTSKWFLVVRAQRAGDDVVKFRQFNTLINLCFVIMDLVRSEAGWRVDKWADVP